MNDGAPSETEASAVWSGRIAAVAWAVLLGLFAVLLWSTHHNSIFFGYVSGLLLFGLVPVGIPLVAAVGIYCGWKGLKGTGYRRAQWGIALNALVLLSCLALWAWAHVTWGARNA